ncbi:hypothetical protein FOZ60_006580 [Perkinsus olseni]|uniref:Uncharacterized protein n=1 Tax=Perkinsus olseni TaxID=32597 RepID=A0A7J6NPB6_PEROL|nr:hypothetical protein FOZ60_006580 [Perkinsus olseni]
MWKVRAPMLLRVMMNTCREVYSVGQDAPVKTVAIPVEEGFVTVSIDGQEVELLLDSAFSDVSVLDGDWYEKKYGKGACQERFSGCYFCPKEAPCKFAESDMVLTGSFGNKSTIRSIFRSGSLLLEGHRATGFVFKVSRYSVWGSDTWRPWGHFGISALLPEAKSPRPGFKRESVLDFLKRLGLIGRLSYSIRTDMRQQSMMNFISGQVTLGDMQNESNTKYVFPFEHDITFRRAYSTARVSSVKLFDAEGNLLTREVPYPKQPGSFMTLIDTGSNNFGLPMKLTGQYREGPRKGV